MPGPPIAVQVPVHIPMHVPSQWTDGSVPGVQLPAQSASHEPWHWAETVADPCLLYTSTRTLCLPRWYCAPCQTDHDCSAAEDGTLQHCVPDAKGNNYCTPECTGNSDCAPDATCVRQWPVCTPNAPAAQACASDDDCPSTSVAYQHCNGGKCTPECGSGAPCGAGQTCGFLDE